MLTLDVLGTAAPSFTAMIPCPPTTSDAASTGSAGAGTVFAKINLEADHAPNSPFANFH